MRKFLGPKYEKILVGAVLLYVVFATVFSTGKEFIMSFSGRVQDFSINIKGYITVKIKNKYYESNNTSPNFVRNIQIGDSLSKRKNSFEYILVKKNRKTYLFK